MRKMEGEAGGWKWRRWAEPLRLGSFNFLLGSSGLRLRRAAMEGEHRAQVALELRL